MSPASPLPSFVAPDYRTTSAAGPEFGALRPCDPSQVVVRRPCCRRHATLARRDGDAFGPAPRDLAEVFARGDEEVGL